MIDTYNGVSVRLPENRIVEANKIAFDDSRTEAARLEALQELLAFSDDARPQSDGGA